MDEDDYNLIIGYGKQFKVGFSGMVSKMTKEYSVFRLQTELLTKILNELQALSKKVNVTYDLEEQLYSDLNLTNITNPRESYALNEFKKKQIDKRLDG